MMTHTETDTVIGDDVAELSLDAQWMPFTANRSFKRAPRLLESAKGMYYRTVDGAKVLDAAAGLWCVNAGHCREQIVDAIAAQAAKLDYAPGFQMGHPIAFSLADRLAELAPGHLDRVFFTNSGSESVDTALKIALAYHRARGNTNRTRFIGRQRGYHGVGFGGISVGGIENNRKAFMSQLLPGVDLMRHTHDLARNAFTRGQPQHGVELADDLERIVKEHGADTIAAVIVEPVAGSTGVLLPPVGYLQRLRSLCDQYGILLIFDEVITGFGRVGASFAAVLYGVTPDLMTVAKGLTNGAVPMGAVFASRGVHDAVIDNASSGIEFFHGYTYSGHPLACAAAHATLDIYEDEALFDRAASLASMWENFAHGLKGERNVIDVRTVGLVAGVELESRTDNVGARGFEVWLECFRRGVLMRVTADTLALSPPLIVEENQIEQMFETLRQAIQVTS